MTTKIPAQACRKWLARVWFIGAGLVFLLLVLTVMMQTFGLAPAARI